MKPSHFYCPRELQIPSIDSYISKAHDLHWCESSAFRGILDKKESFFYFIVSSLFLNKCLTL